MAASVEGAASMNSAATRGVMCSATILSFVAVFAGLGIWLGLRLTRPAEPVVVREIQEIHVPVPVHVPAPATFVRDEQKVGRNDPCPCGSGKKFKKCCYKEGEPAAADAPTEASAD